MPIPEEINENKLAEVALALLCLNSFGDGFVTRSWKEIDWDIMNMLFERGWIENPRGKAKSVVFTEEGLRRAQQFLERHFVARSNPLPPE